jgi:DNA-binding transcriptional regulator YhcF (GntR family)
MTVATTYIDKKSPYPLYHQMKELIREKIAAGEWKPGGPIPAKLQLCKTYHVSMATVNQAVSELQAEGLLESVQGRGTYVAEEKRERAHTPQWESARRRIVAHLKKHQNGPQFPQATRNLLSCIDGSPCSTEAVQDFLEQFAEHLFYSLQPWQMEQLEVDEIIAALPDMAPAG